jgi:hypothetical protein
MILAMFACLTSSRLLAVETSEVLFETLRLSDVFKGQQKR